MICHDEISSTTCTWPAAAFARSRDRCPRRSKFQISNEICKKIKRSAGRESVLDMFAAMKSRPRRVHGPPRHSLGRAIVVRGIQNFEFQMRCKTIKNAGRANIVDMNCHDEISSTTCTWPAAAFAWSRDRCPRRSKF